MANSDKNILITPNRGTTSLPEITFVGFDNSPIRLRVLDDNTLSWEGSSGQLFAISNNITSGSIFSVNDISGIPSIDVNANGTVSLVSYGGSLGIGTTLPTQKLHLLGNIRVTGSYYDSNNSQGSSGQILYSTGAGTTWTTNLTAANLTGTIPSVVLGNSTLYVGTTAVPLNRSSANQTLTGISSIVLPGSTSGTINIVPFPVAGITTLTLPATTGTVITSGDTGTVTSTMIANGTIVDADISASAGIGITKLAASTISGVSLGNNLNTLSVGSGLTGSSYNGSSNVTISIASSVVTDTSTQTLTNKTFTDSSTFFQDDGDITRKMQFELSGITPGLTRTLTIPNASGTIALTSDLPTVNNGTLTLNVSGVGLSGSGTFTANQSGNSTFTVTSNATSANTASTIVARDALGNFNAGIITATLSGNSSTATTLQTSRTLWGQSFNGSANVTGDLTSVGNITGTGAVTLTATSGNLNLSATGANNIIVNTNGSERLRIDSAGNLCLGIIPYSWASNFKALDIGLYSAFAQQTNGTSQTIISWNAYGSATNAYSYKRTGDVARLFEIDTIGFKWFTAPSGIAGNPISFTQAMTLDASSNLSVTGTITGSSIIKSGGTSSQFLKADGSVDSNVYLTSSSVGNGTLTLNVSGIGLTGSSSFTANQSGNATFTVTSNATSSNTASTLVARDASGNFSAGIITATLSGNSTTATTLQTARNINGVSFNGSSDITITANTPNSLTFNNSGSGAASGSTFNGGSSVTVSHNTIGASPLAGSTSLTTTGIVTTGTWSASFGAVSGANLTNLTAANLTGTIPSVVLGNSTLYVGTTAIALNRASANQSLTGISSITLPGSTSGSVTLVPTPTAGTTIITLPATTGTVITSGDSGTVTSAMIADGTIVNADISASASIAISKLAASTISGVTLGNNLNSLTIGNGLSGTSYNGSSAVTIAIDNTVVTLTGTQTLTNKTFTDSSTFFQDDIDNSKKLQFQLSGITANNTRTLTIPDVNGTIITSGDTGTVTSTMIANGTIVDADISGSASIAITKLAASTISGVSLGNNLNTLTLNTSGVGLSGSTTYNGSGAVTFTVTSNATSANTASAIVSRDALGGFTAGIVTATDFNSTSDERLKTNVKVVENPIEKISKINGVSFNWIENNKPSVGVIAQEVEKVLPELVSDGDTKTVNYNGLIGLLIECIKEQQKEIELLKERI